MFILHFCLIVGLLVSLSLLHNTYGQTVITVDGKDGNDTMCRDGSHPCKTLDAALSAVENNRVIIISNGTYYHSKPSTLNYSNITITGSGISVTTIE